MAMEKIEQTTIQLPDIEAIKQRYLIIEKVKKEILTPDDYVKLSNGTLATGKSGWLKYGVAFALSYEILKEEKIVSPTNAEIFTYKITLRAWDPTHTRYADGVGSCTLNEKATYTTEHIVRAMADTRATERCIIKMLGTNEKAADDLPDNMVEDQSIASNFCKDESHKKDHDEKSNKCTKCKKMLRMPQ